MAVHVSPHLNLLVTHVNIPRTSTPLVPVSIYSDPLLPGQPSAEFQGWVVQAVKDAAHGKSD